MQPIKTRVSIVMPDDCRFWGLSVFRDLCGTTTWAELLFTGISGIRLMPAEGKVINDVATMMTTSDARIWPLKVGRIVASYGSPLAGFVSSTIALDGPTRLGPSTTGPCAAFLLEAKQAKAENRLEAFVAAQKKIIPGWGVPLRPVDERFVRFQENVIASGRESLPFWALQEEVSRLIFAERNIHPNLIAALVPAVLDLGLTTPAQVNFCISILCSHLTASQSFESAELRYPEYQTIPLEHVEYKGPPARELPTR